MNRKTSFRPSWNRRLAVPAGLAAIALVFSASQARAGCFDMARTKLAPAAFLTTGAMPPSIGWTDGRGGEPATIVGLWHDIYTATYSTAGPLPVPVIPPGPPDSFQFAETMKTWHADGTEWEEKIQPAPTGFCFGVWKHTANGSIKLHHFGTLTDPTGSVAFIFYMDEINRVAPDGRTYTGVWDFRLYAATDVLGTGPVLQELKGRVSGTRITVE
jgi:hypothetical protein